MIDIIRINISLMKDGKHIGELRTINVRIGDVIVLGNIPELAATNEFDSIKIELLEDGE